MASFSAFLDVKGQQYPLLAYELSIHQETDSLGRPASPTLGGTIDCVLSSPGSDQPFLHQWMFSPTMQEDGKIVLMQDSPRATLKTISFFNAYCIGLQTNFVPGAGGGGSLQLHVRLSPQRIAVGAIVHDNNWPLVSHGAGETFAEQQVAPPSKGKTKEQDEPSAFSEGLHSLLDVVGMIPVIGEVADAANAAIYVAQGDYANAAMSAASMIPLAGNFVGAAKLAKTGAKLAQKAAKVVPPNLLTKLDEVGAAGKTLCTKVGHPIDVATGLLFTEAVDFSLPGTIPLSWERTWYSASDYQGVLGHGWHLGYDLGLTLDGETNVAVLRMADGRQVGFEPPRTPDQSVLDLASGLTLHRPGPSEDPATPWLVWDKAKGLWYTFAQPPTDGSYQPLHTVENATGQFISFQYKADRRLNQLVDSAGRVLSLDYNPQGQLIALFGPHPDQSDERIQLVGYSYDAYGNLVAVTDAEGNETRYVYAGYQLVQETNAVGLSFYFEYEALPQPNLPARCVHTWGDGGIFDTKLQYVDSQTTLVWDSYDQQTRYVHQNGVVSEQTDPLGNRQQWIYSDHNQLLAQTDGLGRTTQFRYDDAGNLTSTRYADGSSQHTDYDESDRPVAFTDARGSIWQYAYTTDGLLATQTDPLGAETAYAYDEQGRLSSVTNALGQTTYLRYDEQDNLAHIVTPDEQIRSRSYDALGRVITLTEPTGAVQTRAYDRLGQLTALTEPDGSQRQLVYDGMGNVIEARQGDQVVQFTYTGQSRLAQRRQAGQQVDFAYDKEGRLTGLTNEAGLHYRFGLDANGQVVEEEGFDGLLRRYERDAAGQVTTVLRPADRSTAYTYDATGQVTQIRYSDGTQEVYGYDGAGGLTKAQNQTNTVRLDRDALGRVVGETQGEHWVEYSYDALGQRTQLTSSLGAAIGFDRDQMGNLTRLSSQSWQAQFGYDQRGLEVQRQLSGGVQMSWQRDAAGRPTQQRITAGGDAPRQRTYAWTTNDILRQIDDSQWGVSQYEHNIFGALTKATYADGTQELRLPDAVGNLFERADKTDRQYGPGGQLLSSQHATYEYDAEGNLTRKTTAKGEVWQYEWAGNGMLSQVVRPDGQPVSFTYDALGRRLSKSYKGKTTRWVWEGNKPLHEWSELSLDGQNTEAVITWLFEEDSFAPIGKLQGSTRHSILTDHLGTPLELVNQSGQRTWQAQTTAYGRIRLSEGTRAECPFRFQGQYEDIETGLYYNRFRYYDPQEGAYVSQDPVGLKGGANLYGYVEDTLTWTDIGGLAGIPSFDALKKMAETTLDFSTAKDGAVFWSGKNMRTAQDWASKVGKTTLEQTVGGKYLNDLKLFENLPGKQAAEIWDIASKRFAEGASGTAQVFSGGAKKIGDYGLRTWWRIEKPALLKNPLVSSIVRMRKDGLPFGSKAGCKV
ncbi:type VI secretion system tube protein TssD [Fibrella arboris]|uniref:type VI secretion system tube protein TssD n=1 Tax=Fibrella arboris TaxID=3242486 RepID=UPI003521184F